MKLLYFSCHSILEYDEIRLFHEIGIDVFSIGAYSNPQGHISLPRPSLPQIPYYPELERAASTVRPTGGEFPQELIDWADVIMFMHEPEILEKNWSKFKGKPVIFRSIGQCVAHQEKLLQPMVNQGLRIVRYSPNERHIPNYCGEDALIRFYKDPEEYKDYNGDSELLINMTQSIRQRADSVFYDEIQQIMKGYPNLIYGIGNEDLAEQWGGKLSPEEQIQVLRNSRAFVYAGTWPASYTLSFIESWMTGIPIISIGKVMAEDRFDHMAYFEVPDLIDNCVNGFVSNSIEDLRRYADGLLKDKELAKSVGAAGRQKAIDLFGKETIKNQWTEYFKRFDNLIGVK